MSENIKNSEIDEMVPSVPEEIDVTAEELTLTPSIPEEHEEDADLTLEALDMIELEEITFEGEDELEFRIEDAMDAYDKAMDDVAGLKK